MKKILCIVLSLILAAGMLVSCDSTEELPEGYTESEEETNYVAISVADYGNIIVELYPDVAPKSVANFKKLVSEKFYDGLIFHRVIKDFMIQGGDPKGNGTGGSDESVEGEFALNGFDNTLKHERGVLSMARGVSGYEQYLAYGYSIQEIAEGTGKSVAEIEASLKAAYNSASSQFFIVHKTSSHLDGSYAAFGKVLEGMDIVDKIAELETDSSDKPTKDVVITSISFISK